MNRVMLGILFFYIVSLPTSMAGMELGSTLLILAFLFQILKSKKWNETLREQKTGYEFWFLGYIVSLIGGTLLWNDLPKSFIWGALRHSAWILELYAMVYFLRKYQNQVFKFLSSLGPFFLILALYGIIQAFTGVDLFRKPPYEPTDFLSTSDFSLWRVKGFFSNAMTYSYSYGMIFFAFFGPLIYLKSDRLKPARGKLNWVAFSLLGLSLCLTFSRGLWIGLFLTGLFVLFLYDKKRVKYLLLVFMGLTVGSLIFSTVLRDRILSIIDLQDISNFQRLHLWKANWRMFLDHPIFGVGFGFNESLVYQYYERLGINSDFQGHAHNGFLQVLSTGGIIGFISLWGFFGSFTWQVYNSWKKRKTNLTSGISLGVLGALLCFYIGSMTEPIFVDGESRHILIFILAIFLATNSRTDIQKA